MVKLGDLVRAHYGKALKKEDRKEHGQFGVFGSSGNIGFHDDYVVDYPTLIVGRKGSVGHIVWAPDGGWVIDTAYFLQINEPAKLDLRYLFYALKRANLASKTITTSIPGLNRDDLYDSEIPLPPLAEQKRIAAILDKADAIRRKRQQAIQLADEFLRAVFLEMFGDPVTNPKGWEVKTLSELVDKLGDGLHGTPVYEQTGGYYFINGNNLRNGRIQINENVKKVSETEYVKHKKELNINTMFVSINGTIGNVAFYRNEPVVLGKSVCYFNIADGVIDKEYLFYLMSSEYFIRYATSKATGSTIKNVSLKTMREFPVPIPDKSAQQLFVKYIEIVKSLNCMEDESVSYSDSLFNSLSQKAFSGQL
ncbi:restriction endonuclease subunit S [Vibrio cholerae]|nr:restriction endonuclease subunit S [Vibrio cholerae]